MKPLEVQTSDIQSTVNQAKVRIFNFWPRLLAFVIDCFIIWALGMTIGFIFGKYLAILGYWGSLVGFVIVLLYFTVFNSRIGHGQTPGKKLCRVKIVRKKDGAYLSVIRSLVRALILIIPFFIYEKVLIPSQVMLLFDDANILIYGSTLLVFIIVGSGYLFLFNRRTRQSIPDLCCGTIVIKEKVMDIGTLKRTSILHYFIFVLILLASYLIAGLGIVFTHLDYLNSPDLFKKLIKINGTYRTDLYSTTLSKKVTVFLKEKPLSFENSIVKIAKVVLDQDVIEYGQKLDIEIRYGHDIGIAQHYQRRNLMLSEDEWQNKLDTISSLAKGPNEFEYYPAFINASSYLQSDWNKFEENYLPQYLFDNRAATAWVEGGKGKNSSGTGEFVSFSGLMIKKVKILKLKIRNGYQKSDSLYFANSRPSKLELFVNVDPNKNYGRKKTIPFSTITLEDKMGWQEFSFPVNQDFRSITLKIKSIYQGTKYTDTCISDLQILVVTDSEYDLPRALENKTINDQFILERINKAKNMANLNANGIVKTSYSKLSPEAVKLLPIPKIIPAILTNKYTPLEVTYKFDYRYTFYNNQQSTLTDREIHELLFNSLKQLNHYTQAIIFVPWIDDVRFDTFLVSPTPVDERYIDEVMNDYDTPFDSGSGKALLLRFLEFHNNKNEILDSKDSGSWNSGSPKVKFELFVGQEKWQGYASKFYITPCCCGGGPRWVNELTVYDSEGFLRWKYQYDRVREGSSSFFIWNKGLPQLERVIILKDVDYQEAFGSFPGLMEVWE